MKKIKILLFTFFVWHVGYSQNFKWKPTIGSNICLQSISDLGIEGKKGVKPGLDIGVIGEVYFKQSLSLEIGGFYVLNKGSLHRLFIYPFPTTTDLPEVSEKYSLNMLKIPINVLFKKKMKNPSFAGLGTVIKYNFRSNRDGKVVGRDEKYSDKFTIETKNGQKTGFGILCFFGKEFEIGKQPVSVRINYDTDLSSWRYPTNFELEKNTYYKMRSHNFSLLVSFVL